MYDTYGFPVDLTSLILHEKGFKLDYDTFNLELDKQKERSRQAGEISFDDWMILLDDPVQEFIGYDSLESNIKIVKYRKVNSKKDGIIYQLVFNLTPFYAESGGQVGDAGVIESSDKQFSVSDTQLSGDQHLHIGKVSAGIFKSGETVTAEINVTQRDRARKNHSATHLMHAALRKVLGPHVEQKGSLVNDEKLRFDFSHDGNITGDELTQIENMVNTEIVKNSLVSTELMSPEQAIEKGAMALFGEKYGQVARVLTMGGDYSVELCGGTHVNRTGDIGVFKIISEAGISSGTRRIEALTGLTAIEEIRSDEGYLDQALDLVRTPKQELRSRIAQLISDVKDKEKEIEELKLKIAASASTDLAEKIVDISGTPFLASEIVGDNKAMMKMLDDLRSKHPGAIIVLAQQAQGKTSVAVGVDGELSKSIAAGELLAEISPIIGVKGGGPAHLARGGGAGDLEKFEEAVDRAKDWVRERL